MVRPIEPTDFRSGDVLLHHSENRKISQAIRFFDDSDYNHSSFLVHSTTSVEATLKGVVESPLPARLDKHDTYVDVYRLVEDPSTFRPVTERAQHYLEQGPRFSKEQLVF
ncbi:MAG: hypothetical protein R3266_11740, partial [Gemmatimonadota bacterium]|nr:hypothetical protein [Gemmatimonadota bacterium]